MQSQEIKKRFSLAKLLTSLSAVFFMMICVKYGLEVYRILISDEVSIEAEMGQGAVDDLLLGTIIVFFGTMLYVNLCFRFEGQIKVATHENLEEDRLRIKFQD